MKKLQYILMVSFGISLVLYANTFNETIIDCNDGNAKACLEAGKTYSAEGYKEKDYDEKEAASQVASLYKRACYLGSAEGCTAYAMSYAANRDEDPKKDARYFFKKGCDGGDDIGCTMLKMMPDQI